MTDKESYRQKMEAQLNQLNEQITELVGKLEAGVGREMESLRPKLKAAREKLDELKQASADAWGDLKPGMEKAWTELRKSFNEASSRFKTPGRRGNDES